MRREYRIPSATLLFQGGSWGPERAEERGSQARASKRAQALRELVIDSVLLLWPTQRNEAELHGHLILGSPKGQPKVTKPPECRNLASLRVSVFIQSLAEPSTHLKALRDLGPQTWLVPARHASSRPALSLTGLFSVQGSALLPQTDAV